MILLEPGNRILEETVAAQINPPPQLSSIATSDDPADSKGPTRQPIDIKLCDFDDVAYRVVIDAADLNTLRLSIQLPCYAAIKDHGAATAANTFYPGLVAPTPDASYDVTLAIPLSPLPSSISPSDLISRLSLFKSTLIGGVFDFYFNPLLTATSLTSPFTFQLRHDTSLFFIPKPDRVTVIFSLQFNEQTDAALAKVFMQEFVEVKRRLGSAPPCTFSQNPPLELKEFKEGVGGSHGAGGLGYISFAVLKNHLEAGKKEKVIAVLQSFRSYMQYHIKCSKSYFHSRMRARVVSLIKILDRAKQEKPQENEKKTISGKTFVRS